MKYLNHFDFSRRFVNYKLYENIEDFPREMTNQNDIEDWVEWSQSNTTDKKEKKLVMDFLNHYFYSKEMKDEKKKMVEQLN